MSHVGVRCRFGRFLLRRHGNENGPDLRLSDDEGRQCEEKNKGKERARREQRGNKLFRMRPGVAARRGGKDVKNEAICRRFSAVGAGEVN